MGCGVGGPVALLKAGRGIPLMLQIRRGSSRRHSYSGPTGRFRLCQNFRCPDSGYKFSWLLFDLRPCYFERRPCLVLAIQRERREAAMMVSIPDCQQRLHVAPMWRQSGSKLSFKTYHVIELVRYTVMDFDTHEYPGLFIFDALPYQIGKVSVPTPYESVASRML